MRLSCFRRLAVTMLLLSLVAPMVGLRSGPASAAEMTEVRTLVHRDLMPSTGTEIIENFSQGGSPILSGDGSTAVYSIPRADGPEDAIVAHVYLFDVGSQVAIEVDQTESGPMLDISDDGSRALTLAYSFVTGYRQVRVATASGGETVAEGNEIVEAVLSGDGETVVFTMTRNGTLLGMDGDAAVAGLYAVDADGGNLRQLVAAEDLRGPMAATAAAPIFMQNYAFQIDVSADGQWAVFDAINIDTGEYYAYSVEGVEITTLGGPYGMLTRLAISGDGSTVLSLTYAYPYDGSAPGEYAVSSFDGLGRSVFATTELTAGAYEKGTMLSEDGSLALLGGTGLLYETASGDAITLAVSCAALSGANLPRLTMDGTGSRFLYLANDYHSPAPLSLLELDLADVPEAAPVISDVTVDPTTLEAGTEALATVSVAIESSGTPAVCLMSLRGVVDDTFGGVGLLVALTDAGENGDAAAGDGVFTSNGLRALAGSFSGPRTIRIKAEVIDADGYRYATAVDVEPFSVDALAPPTMTARRTMRMPAPTTSRRQGTTSARGTRPSPRRRLPTRRRRATTTRAATMAPPTTHRGGRATGRRGKESRRRRTARSIP